MSILVSPLLSEDIMGKDLLVENNFFLIQIVVSLFSLCTCNCWTNTNWPHSWVMLLISMCNSFSQSPSAMPSYTGIVHQMETGTYVLQPTYCSLKPDQDRPTPTHQGKFLIFPPETEDLLSLWSIMYVCTPETYSDNRTLFACSTPPQTAS